MKGLGEGEGIKERGLHGRAEQRRVRSAPGEAAEGPFRLVGVFLHVRLIANCTQASQVVGFLCLCMWPCNFMLRQSLGIEISF